MEDQVLDCCCPPEMFDRQVGESPGNRYASYRDAKGYECNRSHQIDFNVYYNFKGEEIFNIPNFENRLSGRRSKERSLKDEEIPKDCDSCKKEDYKNDEFYFENKKIFKNEWEFDEKEFKKFFQDQEPDVFPRKATFINDPVFEHLMEGNLGISVKINSSITQKQSGATLVGWKNVLSNNFGIYSIDLNTSRVCPITTRYICNLNLDIKTVVYLESTKEYLFFFDVLSTITYAASKFGFSGFLCFSQGDFPFGTPPTEENPNTGNVNAGTNNDLMRELKISTKKSDFTVIKTNVEKNGELEKFQIPISFIFEESPSDLNIECFRWATKKTEFKNAPPCVKVKGSADINFSPIKIALRGWFKNDFDEKLVYPPNIT